MANTVKTIQSNIKQNNAKDMTKYALFMSGTNATSQVLSVYDPAISGYARLFMVKKPLFLQETIDESLTKFKHILEYANTSIQGITNTTITPGTVQGGYNNKGFAIPTSIEDGTNNIQIQVYEFSGLPVHEVIDSWINGMIDKNGGWRHFNGSSVEKIQANASAEFIYVMTDTTGENVEYACLLANCFPTEIDNDGFNYTAGTHEVIQYTIPFQCVKYESLQINEVAKALNKKFKIVSNSLNFYSGYDPTATDIGGSETGKYYDNSTGKLADGSQDYTAAVKPTI